MIAFFTLEVFYKRCMTVILILVDWLQMRCERAETVQKQATIELDDVLDQLRNTNGIVDFNFTISFIFGHFVFIVLETFLK